MIAFQDFVSLSLANPIAKCLSLFFAAHVTDRAQEEKLTMKEVK